MLKVTRSGIVEQVEFKDGAWNVVVLVGQDELHRAVSAPRDRYTNMSGEPKVNGKTLKEGQYLRCGSQIIY